MSEHDENSILNSDAFGAQPEARAQTPAASAATTTGVLVLDRLARDFLAEQKSQRRWKIFFRLVFLLIIVPLLLVGFFAPNIATPVCTGPCTALVRLEGEIGSDTDASAENVNGALRDAFAASHVRGVVLEINSPGGSPVQAGQIYDEIKRLRALHPDIPLYTVVNEMAASGGYYIAAASDAIYADKASILGSIGVIMMNFGFTEVMEKLGIEQRTMTSGNNKAFMDPFSPENEEQKAHMQGLLDNVHRQFIEAVRKGRGDRLNEEEGIFSGLFWDGENAVRIGLADGFGTTDSVARDIVGEENVVDFSYYPGFSERLARQLGTAIAQHFSAQTTHQTVRWK